MLVLCADKKFISELTAYEKSPVITGFEGMYNAYSLKTIGELVSLPAEELTKLLDFLGDLGDEVETNDVFWDHQISVSRELRSIPPKRTGRRLF